MRRGVASGLIGRPALLQDRRVEAKASTGVQARREPVLGVERMMAGDRMAGQKRPRLWLELRADFGRAQASGMEATAARDGRRVRRLSL